MLDEASDPLLELERNRVVVQLAGVAAHKLKQPLAVAWGYLELLLDDPHLALSPTSVAYLREIEDSLRSMDDVINKLQQATSEQTRHHPSDVETLGLE